MPKEKSMINDLTQGNVAQQLIRFSLPFMLSNVLQTVYSLVDMVVIGQYVGSVGLSAVSIGSELMMLLTFMSMGFATAGQVMISQFVGRDDRKAISSTIGTMFTLILGFGVALTIICLPLRDVLLHLMNTPEEAFDHARSYTTVCYSGLVFIFGYNTVSAILRGMGDSKRPFVFIAIAAVTNLVLDLVFVAGMDLGAFGAALATVIGQTLSFVISIVYLYIKRDSFGFDFHPSSFKVDKAKVGPLVKLGVPMVLQSAAVSISMLYVNANVNAYGVTPSAVSGIGGKLVGVMSIVSSAICSAGASMMGQNFGAGKYDRVKKIIHISHAICLSFAVVLSAVVLIFPEQVFGLFNRDADVLAMSHLYAPVSAVGFISFALMSPFNGLINGLGYSTLSFAIGLLDAVVGRVGLSILLGSILGFGIQGFWYGSALAGYVTAIIGGAYYFSGRWRTRKLLIDN